MRKKIPLIGGIINLIESLKGDIGIIENTDVATHSISAGSYVIWKNELYKASSAIAVDDALSSSNLTAVSGGAANELNNNIEQPNIFTPSGVTVYETWGHCWYRKIGNHLVEVEVNVRGTNNTNVTIYTLPEGYRPPERIIAKGGGGNSGDTATMFVETNGNLAVRLYNGDSGQYGYCGTHVIYGV